MSMTSQGFPLWAVDQGGTAHVVVGWDEHGFPELVPVGTPAQSTIARRDQAGYVFTTTDPSAQMVTAELVGGALDDLRERLTGLADEIERLDRSASSSAHLIRRELGK